MTRERAVLVLEDGSRFEGYAWGTRGQTLGEVVFSTGMTGLSRNPDRSQLCRSDVVMTAYTSETRA